jgi:hypothetical protein
MKVQTAPSDPALTSHRRSACPVHVAANWERAARSIPIPNRDDCAKLGLVWRHQCYECKLESIVPAILGPDCLVLLRGDVGRVQERLVVRSIGNRKEEERADGTGSRTQRLVAVLDRRPAGQRAGVNGRPVLEFERRAGIKCHVKLDRLFAILLLLGACSGCSTHLITMKPGASGRVVDAETGAALNGVQVALDDRTSNTLAAASTAADGRFKISPDRERHVHLLRTPIEDYSSASYTLRVQHAGFKPFFAKFYTNARSGPAATNFPAIALEPLTK